MYERSGSLYSGNTVTKSRYYYLTGKTEIEASTLNPQGYISSTIRTVGTSTYEYDNSGYCVKETSSYKYGSQISTQTSTNAYINGNKTSCVETYNGSPNSTNTYEYYIDKENVISSEHLGMNFMGNASKNLI